MTSHTFPQKNSNRFQFTTYTKPHNTYVRYLPVSSPIQAGKGPRRWQLAINKASRLRRDAKHGGRGRGVKSFPPGR